MRIPNAGHMQILIPNVAREDHARIIWIALMQGFRFALDWNIREVIWGEHPSPIVVAVADDHMDVRAEPENRFTLPRISAPFQTAGKNRCVVCRRAAGQKSAQDGNTTFQNRLFSARPFIEALFLEDCHYVVHVQTIAHAGTRHVILNRCDTPIAKVIARLRVVQNAYSRESLTAVGTVTTDLNNLVPILRFATVSIVHDSFLLRVTKQFRRIGFALGLFCVPHQLADIFKSGLSGGLIADVHSAGYVAQGFAKINLAILRGKVEPCFAFAHESSCGNLRTNDHCANFIRIGKSSVAIVSVLN